MQNTVLYFFSDYNFKTKSLWFKKLLWLFLIIKCIYWIKYFDLLFGKNSFVVLKEFNVGLFTGAAFFLNNPQNSQLCVGAIVLLLTLSLLSLMSLKIAFVFDFIIWLLVINLHNRIYPTLTGGDYLLNQFLFFSIFIQTRFNNTLHWKIQLKIFLHNFGVVAILLQICFVYLVSAITKLNDSDWMNGKAVAMTSQVEHYNISSRLQFDINSTFAQILTYAVVIYQLTFPALIWLTTIKKQLIVLGIIIHLYIALVMGLVNFGFLMLIAYVYFWPTEERNVSDNTGK